MQRRNEKPDKDPFITYYVVWPIQGLVESIADFFKWVWRTITGAWWCDHCKAYHGRRVHKHLYHDIICNAHIDRYVCSLGKYAVLTSTAPPDPGCTVHTQDSAEKLVREAYEQLYKEGIYKDLAN